MKLKNSNCDKSKKTKIVTKLKTQNVTKLKFWQNSITQNVTKLKLWHNSKTQIVTKLYLNCYKTWIMTNLNLWEEKQISMGLLGRTFWHLDNWCYVLWAAFCDSRNVFLQFLWLQKIHYLLQLVCCTLSGLSLKEAIPRLLSSLNSVAALCLLQFAADSMLG